MKALKLLALGLVLFGAATRAQGHAAVCATMYSDANYYGYTYVIWGLNSSKPSIGSWWNDKISSLYVGPGCTLTLYQDDNYFGLSQTYTGLVPYVGDHFNDQASSYKCTCAY